MKSDRRLRRSQNPQEAAEMYLEAAAERRAYQALMLANETGEVVVNAPSELNSAALAAVAPHAHDQNFTTDGLLRMVTQGQDYRVWDVDVNGSPHYVAAVGGSDVPPSELERTLRRIFS